MNLTWGGTSIEENGTWFTINRAQILGQTGVRIGYRERWDVGGVIQRDTESELTAALDALEAALAVDGQDLVFVGNDGPTAHALLSANSLNGTRVSRRPSFPKGNEGVWGSGVEYIKRRSFQFSVEAEFLDPDGNIATFHQSVQQLSGLVPRFRMVESLVGNAQRQQIVQFPKTVVVQSGMSVGIQSYPNPVLPLFPGWLMSEPYVDQLSEPMKLGANQNSLYPRVWRYQFEAPYGQIGVVAPPLIS